MCLLPCRNTARGSVQNPSATPSLPCWASATPPTSHAANAGRAIPRRARPSPSLKGAGSGRKETASTIGARRHAHRRVLHNTPNPLRPSDHNWRQLRKQPTVPPPRPAQDTRAAPFESLPLPLSSALSPRVSARRCTSRPPRRRRRQEITQQPLADPPGSAAPFGSEDWELPSHVPSQQCVRRRSGARGDEPSSRQREEKRGSLSPRWGWDEQGGAIGATPDETPRRKPAI